MKFPLNLELMKNPLNWIIIILMVIIGGFVIDLLAKFFSQKEASNA